MSFRSILSHFWSNILLTFKLVFFVFFNNLRQTKPTQPWTQHRGKTLQTAAAPCGTLSIFKHKKSYQTKQTKKKPHLFEYVFKQTGSRRELTNLAGRPFPLGGAQALKPVLPVDAGSTSSTWVGCTLVQIWQNTSVWAPGSRLNPRC